MAEYNFGVSLLNNCKSKPTLTFGIPVKKAEICDLMENPIEEITVENDSLSVDCENFEIITLKIGLQGVKKCIQTN